MNAVANVYHKVQIKTFELILSNSMNEGEALAKYYAKLFNVVRVELIETILTIASTFIPIDTTKDKITLIKDDKEVDFEYSFKGTYQLFKEHKCG
ncbi:hypothetical protein QTG56_25205 (plasmid) [Rossellomorea sp. AcN35-11]|nr:hypothetical protein [Rossellomorea aquimaris]WJV31933.1 hypothetical protein QTG56_25205 [Rossellomorea sp. AcN35-11]